MNDAGKGSKPRKMDLNKFGQNYDKIFRKKVNKEMNGMSWKEAQRIISLCDASFCNHCKYNKKCISCLKVPCIDWNENYYGWGEL